MSQIQTISGRIINLINPDPSSIHLEDIAHSLSHLCRFNGHSNRFYSVAQHSVLVADLLPKELQLLGLMHDATEAYLGDVATPLKRLIPEYQRIENNFWQSVSTKFNLPESIPQEVWEADLTALAIEKSAVLSNSNEAWAQIKHITPDPERIAHLKATVMNPEEARQAFMAKFEEIMQPAARKKLSF